MRNKLILISVYFIFFTGIAFGEVDQRHNPISIQNTPTIQNTQAVVREVLKDKRFHYPDYFSWFKKTFQKIINWLKKLPLIKTKTNEQSLFNIFKWIGLGILTLLLIVLVFLLPKLFSGSRSIRQKKVNLSTNNENPSVLRTQAASLAKEGNYREAIRYLYLANLEYLKINGILPNGIRLTDKANIEAISKVIGPEHPTVKVFYNLVRLFQDKWYGAGACQNEEYRQALHFINIIQENIGK